MAIQNLWDDNDFEEESEIDFFGEDVEFLDIENPNGFRTIDSQLIKPTKEFQLMQQLSVGLKEKVGQEIAKAIREDSATSKSKNNQLDRKSIEVEATSKFWGKIQNAVKLQSNAPTGVFDKESEEVTLSKEEMQIVNFIVDVRKKLSSVSPLYKEFIEKGGSARALNILYNAGLLPKTEQFLPHILSSMNAIAAIERAEGVKLLIKDEIMHGIRMNGKTTTQILSIASGATLSVYKAIESIVEDEGITDQRFTADLVDFDPEAIEISVKEALERGVSPWNVRLESVSSNDEEILKLANYLGLTNNYSEQASKESVLQSLKAQLLTDEDNLSGKEKEKLAEVLGDLFRKKLGIEKYSQVYIVNDTYSNVHLSLHYENMFSYLRKAISNQCEFDVIEAVGIHDYFNDKTSKTFLKSLVNKITTPGGSAIVGNIVPNIEQYFLYAINWPHMFYRDTGDMVEVAKNSGFDSHKLFSIPSGLYHLLRLSKKRVYKN
jgi:hypothetical protein